MSSARSMPAAGTLDTDASIMSMSMQSGTSTEASSITGTFIRIDSGFILQYEYAITGIVPICTASITAIPSPVTDAIGPERNAIPHKARKDS